MQSVANRIIPTTLAVVSTLAVISGALAAPVAIDPGKVSGFSDLDRSLRARSSGSVVRVIVQYSAAGVSDTNQSPIGTNGYVTPASLQSDPASIGRGRESVGRQARNSGVQVSEDLGKLPLTVLEVDKDQLDQLARSGLIANVQEDVLYETTLSTSGPKIQGPKAQSLGALGAGQAVAVIDTGVERNHPFFDAERIVGEACFSSRSIANGTESVCPEGRSFAYGPNAAAPCKDARGCEHGTHVAGIAAGKLGVAPKARIVPIQVFSKFGPRVFSYQSDQIRALQYVLEHASEFNITAVNMSLGRAIKPAGASTPCDTDAAHGYLATLIEDLNEQGVATIIAAGNNKYTRGVGDPACVSSAIAVSSTTVDDQISDFSDVGPTVKLAAPGSNICSSIPGGQFAKLSGTSMAAPQVAGAFVAIKSVVPTKSTRAILTALQATGTLVRDQRDPNGLDVRRINIADAIQMLAGGSVRTTSYVAPRKPTGWCN